MFLIDIQETKSPTTARTTGKSFSPPNESPLMSEYAKIIIIIDDKIVVGTDFFLIPKNNGINPINDADNKYTKNGTKEFKFEYLVTRLNIDSILAEISIKEKGLEI